MKQSKTDWRALREFLPEFPTIQHLPYRPNADRDDSIASETDAAIIFRSAVLSLEEKFDGASVGMGLFNDNPLIRNRTHILRKGYSKQTTAKQQFVTTWNYFYKHKKRFQNLNKILGHEAAVYGEWVFAIHTIVYDRLPLDAGETAVFLPYEIFCPEAGRFYAPRNTRVVLQEAGFPVLPTLPLTTPLTYESLYAQTQEPSSYTSGEQREGIVIKVSDGDYITHRFKMRRPTFVPSAHYEVRNLLPQPKSA